MTELNFVGISLKHPGSDVDVKNKNINDDDDEVDHSDDAHESNYEVKDRRNGQQRPLNGAYLSLNRYLSLIPKLIPTVKKVSPKTNKVKSIPASKEK